jgi:hypothetical protein
MGRAAVLGLPSQVAAKPVSAASLRKLSPEQRSRLSRQQLCDALRRLQPSVRVSARWRKSQLLEALDQCLRGKTA